MVVMEANKYQKLTREEQANLLIKHKQGCIESGNKLVYSILPWIVQTLNKKNKTFSHDELDEITWYVLHQTIRTWVPDKGALSTYSYYICLNALRSFHRKRKREITLITNIDLEVDNYKAIISCASRERDLEGLDYRRRHKKTIVKYIRRLRLPVRRWVIGMRMYKGLTLKEIGKIKGLTRERIRQIEFAAINELKEIMREEDFF